MPVHRVPFWLERVPRSRRPSFPRLRAAEPADVVIVGGGLTGCSCALAFASARVKVVLLEAEAIGQAGTARSHGLVREDYEASFCEAASAHGPASARTMWQALRRGSLELAAVLRRLDARAALRPMALLDVAPRGVEAALEREYRARRAAGLRHSWATPRTVAAGTALESGGAIRTCGAEIDPYGACLALAAAAARRGAVIHEQSRVVRVRHGGTGVEVTTEAGSVRAESVVVATGDPIADLRALRRHLKPMRGYSVVTEPLAASMRRSVGKRAEAVRQGGVPPHLLRWMPGDRVLFTGGDQPELPPRARERALIQRTGQLMYELSLLYPEISGLAPAWAWDAVHYDTADHLPFAGPHRNFPRHLFAIGGGRHGAAFSWLAARTVLRAFQGKADKGDDLFGFARVL